MLHWTTTLCGQITTGLMFLTGLTTLPCVAQIYPSKPLTVIYPYGAGGGDTMLRAVASGLSERLGQPVIVESRPGGNEVVAMQALLNAPMDGHTLVAASNNFTVNVAMQKLPYEQKDFAPITPVSKTVSVLTISSALPVKTLDEFIAYAKTNPGKINFGSIGNQHYLHYLMLSEMAGVQFTQVPFNSPPDILRALLGGHIDAYFNGSISVAAQNAREGKLRIIGAATPERFPEFPEIPAIGERVPDFEMVGWIGLFAKTGTARPVIDRVQREVSEVVARPETARIMNSVAFRPMTSTPEQFAEIIRRNTEIYVRVARKAGIVPK